MAADTVSTGPLPRAVVVLGNLHYDIVVESQHRPIKGETATGTADIQRSAATVVTRQWWQSVMVLTLD